MASEQKPVVAEQAVAPTAGLPSAQAKAPQPHAQPPAPVASSQALEPSASPEDLNATYSGPLGSHQRHFSAWLGVRNDYVRDAHYDLFATNDALTAFSLGISGVVLTQGNFSLAVLGLWETGSRDASARGDKTEFRVHRLEAGAEGRYHLGYRAYLFGRLSLGPSYTRANMVSSVAGGELVSKDWLFSSAATLGGAFRLFGDADGVRRHPRLWLVAEGGYALAGDTELRFEPADADESFPARAQPQELGAMNLSAPLFRAALAFSY